MLLFIGISGLVLAMRIDASVDLLSLLQATSDKNNEDDQSLAAAAMAATRRHARESFPGHPNTIVAEIDRRILLRSLVEALEPRHAPRFPPPPSPDNGVLSDAAEEEGKGEEDADEGNGNPHHHYHRGHDLSEEELPLNPHDLTWDLAASRGLRAALKHLAMGPAKIHATRGGTRSPSSSTRPLPKRFWLRNNIQTRFASFGTRLTPNPKLKVPGSTLFRYGRSADD